MSKLKIQLFGKFCVERNKQVLDGFDARKVSVVAIIPATPPTKTSPQYTEQE